jgi:hypothetical protein
MTPVWRWALTLGFYVLSLVCARHQFACLSVAAHPRPSAGCCSRAHLVCPYCIRYFVCVIYCIRYVLTSPRHHYCSSAVSYAARRRRDTRMDLMACGATAQGAALLVRDLGDLWTVFGSTCGFVVMFAIPASGLLSHKSKAIYFRYCAPWIVRLVGCVLLLGGAVTCGLCIVVSLGFPS